MKKRLFVCAFALVVSLLSCVAIELFCFSEAVDENVEALSNGEGLLLKDCKEYKILAKPFSVEYVCKPGTSDHYIYPCSYEGTGGTKVLRCY